MFQKTSDWGGARTNGKVRFRKNGRFVKTPTLDVDVCQNCNRINTPTIEPRYSDGGMIDPASMRPVKLSECHACGFNFSDNIDDYQLENYLSALCAIAREYCI